MRSSPTTIQFKNPQALQVSAALLILLVLVTGRIAATPQQGEMKMTISSPSFPNGGAIDKKFTCDGADVSPQLAWTEPPTGTKAFALLADDPDHPSAIGITGRSGTCRRQCARSRKALRSRLNSPTAGNKA